MKFSVCKACVKSTGCVLHGNCQGERIGVHEPAKGQVIMVILGYEDFREGSLFTILVMIIGSKSKWSKDMVEAALV